MPIIDKNIPINIGGQTHPQKVGHQQKRRNLRFPIEKPYSNPHTRPHSDSIDKSKPYLLHPEEKWSPCHIQHHLEAEEDGSGLNRETGLLDVKEGRQTDH